MVFLSLTFCMNKVYSCLSYIVGRVKNYSCFLIALLYLTNKTKQNKTKLFDKQNKKKTKKKKKKKKNRKEKKRAHMHIFLFAGLGGSVGCAVRLETRRSRV